MSKNTPGELNHSARAAGPSGSARAGMAGGRRFAIPMLARGESTAATIGVVGAALMLTVILGTGWWALRSASEARLASESARVRVASGLLAGTAETMLARGDKGDLSALRRLVAEASLNYDLAVCRVRLPDGGVLAAANPRDVTVADLPEKWPVRGARDGEAEVVPGLVRTPIEVAGRGEAVLEVSGSAASGWVQAGAWEAAAGVGAIGAASLGAMLAAYRVLRSRLRALGAIHDALAASARGESATALALAPNLGPEAAAWNAILDEREALRQRVVAEKAEPRLVSMGRGDGDLASACDALWHGLLLVDDGLRVKYANGAAAIFLGQKRDSMPGMDLAALERDPALIAAVKGVVEGRVRGKQVVELRRDRETGVPGGGGDEAGGAEGAVGGGAGGVSGERRGGGRAGWSGGVLRLSVRPVRREDSAAAMILIEDVTQQRVADEARNSFVAQATHELRTPLTTMRLYIEQLQEGDGLGAVERAQAINVVNQECRRLERIVADMLSVSEIEAGSLRLHEGDVRLAQLVADLKQDLEPQAKSKSVALKFDVPPKLPVLKGDRDKIMLAAHNLLGNAIKYTPEGGQVTMRVEESGGQLVMEFVDNGIGIREDEHEKIFEKFYRARDKRIAGITGSGLGLALAREVARLHGGDIAVRSQVDKGSTFTLTLPMPKSAGGKGSASGASGGGGQQAGHGGGAAAARAA
ncbi:MAG: hypothetical protein JNK35_13780 [Phycisphaerae bacterium]|nr:hypothetical protein [Phycisphaerae bacterium]